MDYEWDSDMCCAICRYGCTVHDAEEGDMVYCEEKTIICQQMAYAEIMNINISGRTRGRSNND